MRSRTLRISLFALIVCLAALTGYRLLQWRAAEGRLEALRGEVAGANVVICVMDAARADHLGCYGYPRPTTPNVDELAKESLVFTDHFCQFTRTKESTASLFTSQYADTHLAYERRPLEDGTFTMAKGLSDAGLDTALFSSNFNASPVLGLGPGFEETFYGEAVRAELRKGETEWAPEPLLRLFGKWLAKRDGQRFFAYVHFTPPHQPYEFPGPMGKLFAGKQPPGYSPEKYHPLKYDFPIVPEETTQDFPPLPEWINLYDSNLRYADWAVGEAVRQLREAGVLDKTLLIVTSDHGEAFGEHGFVWHGEPIHDEVGRIPLVIRFPKASREGRVTALTQSIDLLPMIFELFRLSYPPDSVQGRSLAGLIAGNAQQVNRYGFTKAAKQGDKYMVRDQQYALLLWGNGKWRALYDLKADPEQRTDVLAQRPEEAAGLTKAFRSFALKQRVPPLNFLDPAIPPPPLPPIKETDLPPDVERHLRALGYLK